MPIFDLNTLDGLLSFGQWLFKWDYANCPLECYIKVGGVTVTANITGVYKGADTPVVRQSV